MQHLLRLALVPAVLGTSLPAVAQDLPTAVLLRTHAGDGVAEATAHGFDRVLRQRLDAVDVVTIEGSVELDLEAIQLALGCIGETESCLGSVAEETGGTLLVYASLDVTSGSSVVSVNRFDSRDGTLRRAVRTVGADEVLATADAMIRELWDLPPSAEVDDGPDPVPVATPGLSPVPFVVLGLGVAIAAGGGAALGIGFSDADRYRNYFTVNGPPESMADIDAALAIQSQAQTELAVGSVLLGVGGAAIAAGTIWAIAGGREDGSSPLAVVPTFCADGVFVGVMGTLPGGSL